MHESRSILRRALYLVWPLLAAGLARADVVVQRWGAGADGVQHPQTIKFAAAGGVGALTVDLAALPKGAKVYRARLFLFGTKWDDVSFKIVPQGQTEPLALPGPYFTWFDAAAAVRDWAAKGGDPKLAAAGLGSPASQGKLELRQAPKFAPERTVLEIAYEGKLPAELPPQASDVRAVCRDGQVFVTFKEIDPPDGGKAELTWADLAGKFNGDFYGPTVGGPLGKRRYQLLRHTEPITPANIGQAVLAAEVLPGSAINTRQALRVDPKTKRESIVSVEAGRKGENLATGNEVQVLRVAVEPGKPVDPGCGAIVATVADEGKFWYAVVTADDGAANTRDISDKNMVGPVEQRKGPISPVMYKQIATPVRGGTHLVQWHSLFTDQPLSPWPARYDVVTGHCPELLAKPAPVHFGRDGWNSWASPPGPSEGAGVYISHTAEMPVEFHTGLHDAMGTIKGFDGGRWQSFWLNREDVLVQWARRAFSADPNRITSSLGAWGAMEIYRGDTFCYLTGWGLTELTKGFQSWQRSVAIWGQPSRYAGVPDAANPYVVSNITDWVAKNPRTKLPFLNLYARGGSHWSEMGWPPMPRFLHVLIQSRRAFVYSGQGNPVEEAIRAGEIRLRLDESAPALGNCSLDGNPGDGDLGAAENFGAQVNGYVLWDSDSIRDEKARWAIELWIDAASFYPTCTVDLTPRRCQRFRPQPGMKFTVTNTLLAEPAPPSAMTLRGQRRPRPAPATATATAAATAAATAPAGKLIQTLNAAADADGFVTAPALELTKGRHRIVFEPAIEFRKSNGEITKVARAALRTG